MESSPLTKLPAEVRNHIYALAIHEPKGINIRPNGLDTPANKHLLALTAVCPRVICAGSMDDYDTGPEYEDFPAPWSRSPIIGWFSKVGQKNLMQAPQLTIELGELMVTFDDELEIDFALDQTASEVPSQLSVDSKPLQNVVLVFKVHHLEHPEDLGGESSYNEEEGLVMHYRIRYGQDKATTQADLQKSLETTMANAATIVYRDWDDDDLERLHDLVCDAVLHW
ncbi:hypothetical protein LTS10_001521 [Elasticomyces elasticus]|nr:hypothetical protein LTS10_001521 [Elasticomyces elasticus]